MAESSADDALAVAGLAQRTAQQAARLGVLRRRTRGSRTFQEPAAMARELAAAGPVDHGVAPSPARTLRYPSGRAVKAAAQLFALVRGAHGAVF